MADTSYLGEIQVFGFNYAPYGWALCAGQVMNAQQFVALYTLLGNQYAGGNGTTTFALPDLRGRVAIGQGQGPGLTDRIIGETGGQEAIVLTQTEMPLHSHVITGGASSIKVSGQVGIQPGATLAARTLGGLEDTTLTAQNFAYNNATPDIPLNAGPALSGTVGLAGSSSDVSILQPTLGLNYCICIMGEFPQRS